MTAAKRAKIIMDCILGFLEHLIIWKDEERGTQYDIVSMEQNRSRVAKRR